MAPASSSSSSNFLPPEIITFILSFLCVVHRFRCRLVGRSWAEADHLRPPPRQLPWLMLSLRRDNPFSLRFLGLTGGTMFQVKLPEQSLEAMCCGSIDGFLILNCKSMMTYLFNPLSKSLSDIHLALSYPSVVLTERKEPINTPHYLRKVVYSSPPDSNPDQCHVAVIYDPGLLLHGWKIMNDLALGDDFIVEDILFDKNHKTKLWAVTIHEKISFNIMRKDSEFEYEYLRFKRLEIVQRDMNEYDLAFRKHVYLLQLNDSCKLVMILRYYQGEGSDKSTVMFKVYEHVENPNPPDPMDYDGVDGNWVQMDSLEGNVIFLSSNCSRAIPASNFEGSEEDKIYFSDEIRGVGEPGREIYECGDVGVFSLKDESITRLVESRVNSSDSPPAWFFHMDKW